MVEHCFFACSQKIYQSTGCVANGPCSGHDLNETDPEGQVTVFLFPPNTTSILQPMDQGIIATVKVNYRQRLLAEIVEKIYRYEECQAAAKKAAK